jgi:23S rRNA pseudouridine2605 synthase
MVLLMFMEKRLQKILSEVGIASRRTAEDMIMEGRVTVNGRIATIGMKADPSRDHIKVDKKLIIRPEPKVYIAFHKPKNVVTSLHDPEGRPTVKDFLKGIKYRVYPVGRLDYDSEGLLLLTNDGDFAHAVMHPSRKIAKTYQVKVKGKPEEKEVARLRTGIHLDDGMTSPARVKIVRTAESNSWIEMTINEGKKRQIRRMLEKIGHTVLKLKRIRINGIELGRIEPGRYRYLTVEELEKIKQEVSPESAKQIRR